jgi:hypothetical protein
VDARRVRKVRGSVGGFDNKSLSGPLPAPLTPNENPLRDAERGLNDGDEAEIARQLRAIDPPPTRASS